MLGKGKLMNCTDITEFAPHYLSGDLDPARAESFHAHLRNCAACRREVTRQAGFDETVRAGILAERIDTTGVDRRVRRHIEADVIRPTGELRYMGEPRASRRRIVALAAIAALLLVSLVTYRFLFSGRITPVYAAAARDHRAELVEGQPRKWIVDRASIERLANAQGLPGLAVARLAPAGYRLTQGKLCFLQGRIFLHLVYAKEGGNLSLFLRREVDPGSALTGWRIRTAAFNAEQVTGFQTGRVSALVVTPDVTPDSAQLAVSLAQATRSIL
jgi:anti-sigma factor RsiW